VEARSHDLEVVWFDTKLGCNLCGRYRLATKREIDALLDPHRTTVSGSVAHVHSQWKVAFLFRRALRHLVISRMLR